MGIDAVHLDARTAIVTDGKHTQAAPLFIETNALPRRRVSRAQVTVMVDEASPTPEFRRQLGALAEVEVLGDRALVTMVGQNVSRNPSNIARASQQLRKTPGGAMLGWCSDSRFAFILAREALSNRARISWTFSRKKWTIPSRPTVPDWGKAKTAVETEGKSRAGRKPGGRAEALTPRGG